MRDLYQLKDVGPWLSHIDSYQLSYNGVVGQILVTCRSIAVGFIYKERILPGYTTANLNTDYLMPPTSRSSNYSIWSTTTIILVDGNLNMVRGNLRHLDRSTTITNTDSFNVELGGTVPGLSLLSTTSMGKFFLFGFEASRALI